MLASPPNQNQPNLSNNIDRVGELLKELKDSIDNVYKDVYESTVALDESLSTLNAKMAGTLGQTQKAIAGLRQEAAIAYPTIVGLGGDFADVQTIQQGIAKQLKTNVITLGETVSGLYAGAKAVGISSDEIGGMVEGFQSAGIQTANIKDNLQSTVDIARRVGVNTNAVFKGVQDNLSAINKYGFQNGVEGLARMSAQAAGLRINMNEIFGFAEKVFNPEGAVEMVSVFQRMGVAAGDLADPFRLMYLASEDTEELQKQVVKMTEKFTYFDEKNKEFKVLPSAKRDLREIANQTGIQYEELIKMSTAGQKLSMISKDFKLPGIDEESKQFIANVATYSKEKGGFTVKVSGEQKLVSQLNTNDLKELKEAQAPVSLEDLAKEQLDEATLATKTLQEIKAVLTATAAGSRGTADVREIIRGTLISGGNAVRESAGNVRGGIKGANKFYEETGTGLMDLMKNKEGADKLAKTFEDGGISIQNGLKKMGDSFKNFNFEATASKYISSGNKIAEGASAAKKKLEELFSSSKPVSSSSTTKKTGVQGTTTTQQNTNVTFNPLKVMGEVTFNMKSPDGSVTKLTQSQIQQVINSAEFQKTIQNMFKNMQTTGNYGNIPSNAGKY